MWSFLTTLSQSFLLHSAPPTALPAWAQTHWTQSRLSNTFRLARYATPGFRQANFNGDGKLDVALLVTRTTTQSAGMVSLHQGQATPYVVGTGPAAQAEILHEDFSWVSSWWLYRKSTALETLFAKSGEVQGTRRVVLKYPALEPLAEEQGGGLIYWDGQRYRWIHQTC